ncbi:insulinase family protein [Massilia arenosa]|uniref:Insulinase family protein n=1 Tax=Zemynaea arenosa TaxID=2561931 RepID=A0A4Y9S740_9BURK|nr:pitrilysin family protein [Massilia arenosa]TFW17298.1 insulinase family protein [Massilia arenosa]
MKLLTVLMLSAGLLSPAFAAGPTVADKPVAVKAGAPVKVTSVEGITEYRLANGLRVLLFPDPSQSTMTTNIIYMVGSRHENYGETGMAHLLEHLLFKPSANFGVKKGTSSPVEVFKSLGADFNGTTWFDRTNYYATFPANEANLSTMLALEADRMVNARIAQADLWNDKAKQGEMTVVRNEFEMGESDPVSVTTDRLQAVAYDWHNYGKSTIGARSDIEHVNIDHLRAFYHRYYQPDNAVLMVAGRIDESKVLKEVAEKFGRIPKPKRVLEPTYTEEPVQDGERAVTVRRTGGTQYVAAGYHVPPSGHEDAAALRVLSRVLVDQPSGRLHKALVDTHLATKIEAITVSNLEPGYRIFGATVTKDQPLEPAQNAMLTVLEDLKANPVTDAEVARAKAAIDKDIELAQSNTARLAIALTESMAAGDWRLFFIERDRLAKVDAKAVQAAADKYFKPANRTVGRFVPTDTPDRATIPSTPDIASLVKDYHGRAAVAQGEAFDPSPANIESRTTRFTLANGMNGALLPKKTKGEVVNVALRLRTGSAEALAGKQTVGTFTANLLDYGTQLHPRQELKDAWDKLKAQVRVGGDAEGVTVRVRTTRGNLPAVMELVAEMLRKPAFADADFAEFQRATVGNTEQAIPEPMPLASNAFQRMLDPFPAGHVKHTLSLTEALAEQKAVKLDDVKAFHKEFYGADHASVVAVGDFDAAAFKAQMGKLFGDWKAARGYVRVPREFKAVNAQTMKMETPDKANSMLFAVLPLPMKDDAKIYPALLMADYMLGGGALSSRLANRIRQKEGLSYGIGSDLSVPAQDAAGMWLAYAISAPENTAKVEAALRDELTLALKDGFTEAELAEAKKGWLRAQQVNRTDDAVLASQLAAYLNYGRTMAFDQQLEERVNAVKLADVNAALREYVKPENINIVSAGDFAKVKK